MGQTMNERIRELIEKATVRGEEYLPGNDGHPTPTVYFDKEKFAELIVAECAVPMITQARTMDADGRYQNSPIEVNAMHLHQGLLKHFGVEE